MATILLTPRLYGTTKDMRPRGYIIEEARVEGLDQYRVTARNRGTKKIVAESFVTGDVIHEAMLQDEHKDALHRIGLRVIQDLAEQVRAYETNLMQAHIDAHARHAERDTRPTHAEHYEAQRKFTQDRAIQAGKQSLDEVLADAFKQDYIPKIREALKEPFLGTVDAHDTDPPYTYYELKTQPQPDQEVTPMTFHAFTFYTTNEQEAAIRDRTMKKGEALDLLNEALPLLIPIEPGMIYTRAFTETDVYEVLRVDGGGALIRYLSKEEGRIVGSVETIGISMIEHHVRSGDGTIA